MPEEILIEVCGLVAAWYSMFSVLLYPLFCSFMSATIVLGLEEALFLGS